MNPHRPTPTPAEDGVRDAWLHEHPHPHCGGPGGGGPCRRRCRRIRLDSDAVLAHDRSDTRARLLCADVILGRERPTRRAVLAWARQVFTQNPGCALVASRSQRGRLIVATRDGTVLALRTRICCPHTHASVETVTRALHSWWATRDSSATALHAVHLPAACRTDRAHHLRVRHTHWSAPVLRPDRPSASGEVIA